jgi:hypothetical protein
MSSKKTIICARIIVQFIPRYQPHSGSLQSAVWSDIIYLHKSDFSYVMIYVNQASNTA